MTQKEFLEEARRALEAHGRMTPQERWEFLIREGIIDSEGRVICQKLFGDYDGSPPPAPAEPPKNGD